MNFKTQKRCTCLHFKMANNNAPQATLSPTQSEVNRIKQCVQSAMPSSFRLYINKRRIVSSWTVNEYDAHIVSYFETFVLSVAEQTMCIYGMLFFMYLQQHAQRRHQWYIKRNQRFSLTTARMVANLDLKGGLAVIKAFTKNNNAEMFPLHLLVVGLRGIERKIVLSAFDAINNVEFATHEQFLHTNIINVWLRNSCDFQMIQKALKEKPEIADTKVATVCQFMDIMLTPTTLLYKFLSEPTFVRASTSYEMIKCLATKKNLQWSFNAQGNSFHLVAGMFAMTTLDGRALKSVQKEAERLLKIVMLMIVKGASSRLWHEESNKLVRIRRYPLRCLSPKVKETLGIQYWALELLKTLHVKYQTPSVRQMHFTPHVYGQMLPSTKLTVFTVLGAAEASSARHGLTRLNVDVLLHILNMLAPTEMIPYCPNCDLHEECSAGLFNAAVLPSMKLRKTRGYKEIWKTLD